MMKRAFVAVGVIVLAAALVFLNQGLKKSAQPDHDDDEKAQQQAQKPSTAPGDPTAPIPPEETLGDPATAKHHIQVGWVYDEANQLKPETLSVSLQMVREYVKHSGNVSAEIVDMDVPAEDRSPAAQTVTALGIIVDGKSLYSGNVSGMQGGPEIIPGALTSAIK